MFIRYTHSHTYNHLLFTLMFCPCGKVHVVVRLYYWRVLFRCRHPGRHLLQQATGRWCPQPDIPQYWGTRTLLGCVDRHHCCHNQKSEKMAKVSTCRTKVHMSSQCYLLFFFPLKSGLLLSTTKNV